MLLESGWQDRVNAISRWLEDGLRPCAALDGVRDVCVLGAIGVIEMDEPVDIGAVNHAYIDQGVWLCPFNRLIYTMPPYIATEEDIKKITRAMRDTAADAANANREPASG